MLILYIISILLSWIYYSYYTKVNNFIQINQVFLEDFKPDLLYEKNPILIYDRLQNPDDLTKTIFKYTFLFKKNIKKNLYITKSKYTIVYSEKDTIINITPRENFVTIKIAPYQVIILPYGWKISSEDTLDLIQLDDIFSKIFCH